MSKPEEPIKTAKFGWCLSNQHDACSKQNGDLKCHCSCHSKEGRKKKSVKRK